MGIGQEVKLWFKDSRRFLFRIPRSKYQMVDKVIIIALIVFPIILMFLFIVF